MEGLGNPHELNKIFDERTQVYASSSQAQLGGDSEETQAPSSPCAPISFFLNFVCLDLSDSLLFFPFQR